MRTIDARLFIAWVIGVFAYCNCCQAEAEPLHIAIVSRTVFYLPVWIADRMGFFKEEGVEATIEVYNNAEKIDEDLHAEKVQIAVSTPERVIADAYHGGTLRLIAGNAERLPHFIIARPEIKTLPQLKGARVGVLSTEEGTIYLVREIAKAAGLTAADYQIMAVGGAPTRWKLLKERKIDVGLQPFPLSYEAEAAGFSNLGPVSKYVPNYQFTSINLDTTWGQAHRQLVVSALRAIRRGQDYLVKHRHEAAEIGAEELKSSVADAERALQDTEQLKILSPDLSVSRSGIETVFATVKSLGLLPPDSKFDRGQVIDDSYLKASK